MSCTLDSGNSCSTLPLLVHYSTVECNTPTVLGFISLLKSEIIIPVDTTPPIARRHLLLQQLILVGKAPVPGTSPTFPRQRTLLSMPTHVDFRSR